MYITRFLKTNDGNEDYLYKTEKEARNHLELFLNDDSGLYRNISVIDDDISMRILCILPFKNGIPGDLINAGDIVRLKEEYSHPEERTNLYVVKNMNEQSENIQIMCITSDMVLKPIETVKIDMIEPAK